jgi:hypothetical protein
MSSQMTAYTNLVNQPPNMTMPATPCAGSAANGFKRVTPGSSATSLLYSKVTTTPVCGARMPKGCGADASMPCLTDAQVALIKSWIDSGATNN